jgi:ABC-type multidrug transport system fused ATPase/permease subunit
MFSGVLEGLGLAAVLPLMQATTETDRRSPIVSRMQEQFDVSAFGLAVLGLGFIIVLGVLSAVGRFLAESRALKVMERLENRMKKDMVGALFAANWPYFASLRVGDVNSSTLVAVPKVSLGAVALLRAAGNVLVALAFVVLAAAISVPLTALTLLFGAIAALGYRRLTRRAADQTKRMSAASQEMSTHIAEAFGHHKFIRATGSSGRFQRYLDESFDDYDRAATRAATYGVALRGAFDLAGLAFIGLVLGYLLVTQRRLPTEGIVFLAVFYRLAPRLSSIQDLLHNAQIGRTWLTKWQADLDAARFQVRPVLGTASVSLGEELRFVRIGFSYPSSARPVLDDVSFVVRPGQSVAIVGASGAGKTTILDLATGLLSPTLGTVSLDGRSLAEIDVESWQHRIGLVTQDSALINATVAENIAWDDDRPDGERIAAAAALANASEFIEGLPHGLHTVVGDRGGLLSGGQRQRIALARALYRDPLLLILDEATSALDSASEAAIQSSLRALRGSVAMLIVAHRLTTVRIADEILVLSDGRVVESGTWEHLIGTEGAFSAMVERQGLGSEDEQQRRVHRTRG